MYLTFTLADGTIYNVGPLDDAAIIGRSEEESGIVLPSDSLSAQHAIIEAAEDGADWQIRDLESANGISDGTSQSPAFLLTDGATVFLGDVRLDVSFAAPAVVQEPVAGVSNSQADRLRAAQIERLRVATSRRNQSGGAFLILVLGILAFVAGFAVRYVQ